MKTTEKTTFIYNKDVLLEFLKDYTINNVFSNLLENGVSKSEIVGLKDNIKDELYFILPNPSKNFKLLVYAPKNENYCYYVVYNNSKELQQYLKKSYKNYLMDTSKGYNIFYKYIPYDSLIRMLYTYSEEELTENRAILLSNFYVFDNIEMKFDKEPSIIPIDSIPIEYNSLTEENEELLGTIFNIMYPSNNEGITDYDKFLYYILCICNKKYAPQTVFITVDKSGIGKTARIAPFTSLKLNIMASANVFKGTELYNIAYNNSVTINEIQSENNKIDGSILNNLVDSVPLTVTRKNKDAIDITTKDKPVLTIMGESQPLIKSLSDGTNRRFALLPTVSEEFKKSMENKENKELKQRFYNLLYEEPTQVIEFYSKQIDIHNIKERAKEIRLSMNTTPEELEELIEVKEEIFERYFILNPEYENTIDEKVFLIDSKHGLNELLNYIDRNIVTVGHIGNTKGRRKYLNQLIKNETGVKNLKDFGISRRSLNNKQYSIYYAYSLTLEGVDLVEKINSSKDTKEKIQYFIIEPIKK